MNPQTLTVAIVSFLLGVVSNAVNIIPFHWGFPFFASWDSLITILLLAGLFMVYSKVRKIEKRMNQFDPQKPRY